MENDIDLLFDKVAKIAISKNERELAAQKRGEKFNIFELLGLQSDETRLHSTLLAELLNPSGKHGLGDEPLKLFLQYICQNRLPNLDTNNVIVEKEHFIANLTTDYKTGGRIDILIYDTVDNKPKNAIIIENKIYAGDQYKQLYRYRNFAKDKFQQFVIFYLNLFGNPASQESEGDQETDKVSSGEDYLTLSYKYDIIPWLKQCRSLAIDKPYVREVLGIYIDTLNTITDNNMNNTEKEELFKSMDKHIEATAEIISAASEYIPHLVRKYIVPELLNWAKEKKLSCDDVDDMASGKNYCGIFFYKTEWRYGRKLGLSFQQRNFGDLIYGIVGPKIAKKNGVLCLDGFKSPNDTWHYGWQSVEKFNFLTTNVFGQIQNGEVAKSYINILDNLYQTIIENGVEM